MAIDQQHFVRHKREGNDDVSACNLWRDTDSNWTISTYRNQNINAGQISAIRGNLGDEIALLFHGRFISDYTVGEFNFSVCEGPNPLNVVQQDLLDFSRNCSISAQYMLTYRHFTIDENLTSQGQNRDLSIAFWREALPEEWRHVADCHINDYFLKSRYFLRGSPSGYFMNLLGVIQHDYFKEVCQGSGFSGNPDIMGTGMLIGYVFMAVMTTLYLLAFSKRLFRACTYVTNQPALAIQKRSQWIKRNVRARNTTATSFLGGCTLICYIAWFAEFGQGISGGVTMYDRSVAYVVALFSINPSTCMLALLFDYDDSVGLVSGGAVLLQFYWLYAFGAPSLWLFRKSGVLWLPDYFCFEGYARGAYPTTVAGVLALGYIPPLLVVLAPLILWLKGTAMTRHQRDLQSISPLTREILRTFTACYACIVGWVDLALLLNMRRAEEQISGETYAENTWGYGQYAAVFGSLALIGQYLVELIKPGTLPAANGDNPVLDQARPDPSDAAQ